MKNMKKFGFVNITEKSLYKKTNVNITRNIVIQNIKNK